MKYAAWYSTLLSLLLPAQVQSRPSCLDGAASALARGEWSGAVTAARAALERAECAAESEFIEFNLAAALEQISSDQASEAHCEAVTIYRRLAEVAADADVAAAAATRAGKMGQCIRTGAASPDNAPPTEPPPAADDSSAMSTDPPMVSTDSVFEWSLQNSLLIGAGALALAGAGVYVAAYRADNERAEAKEDVLAAENDEARSMAIEAWGTARDRTDMLGYIAVSLTVAAASSAALGLLMNTDEINVSAVPAGVSVYGAF